MKQVGIIARTLNQDPALVGYDIIEKNPHKKTVTGPDDYKLLFRGMEAEHNSASVEKLVNNLNSTIDRVFEDEVEVSKKIDEVINENDDEVKIKVKLHGEIIKSILEHKGKEYAELRDENADDNARELVNRLIGMWSVLRVQKYALEKQITHKMRVGTLDIFTRKGERMLVVHTPEGHKPATGNISAKQIKASLFFMLNIHVATAAFKKHVNCSFRDGNFEVYYKEGGLDFTKYGSPPTAFEESICKDLKKIKG